ncbi:hypothetical protein MPTK1_1g22990 [Marchantia polymorpha subsp. ruderalis]|uniref:Uncharacterized protein n=2 Tax=Marchantia polymorpha TaxID=3197 RepID=A0AAF6ATA9_MARPO|nr:hypothetical protein MARPO_0065s0077 [Marchantia polymorpha]BBM99679.1 hypothetical protein Mp_1g22990 [Marchantia polymorpha subsp. ruderalis]|eukprot:PTQ36278.1 hypothetical protein MARPO_0065s0077 [Marchantia polymorpha]
MSAQQISNHAAKGKVPTSKEKDNVEKNSPLGNHQEFTKKDDAREDLDSHPCTRTIVLILIHISLTI